MHIMTVEQLGKSYGEKTLFKEVSFGISKGDRFGIVGVNGTGKSTFLKTIAGIEPIEEGKILRGSQVSVQYVAQEPEFEPHATVLETVLGGRTPEMSAVRAYTELLEQIAEHPDDVELQRRLVKASDDMDRLQAWQLESEAKTILSKLGIHHYQRKVSELSGGQRKRVALAAGLIHQADVLLLDEPTNHVDNETVAWLEALLQKRSGALIMITHDRYFLDRVANKMMELDHGRAFFYEANYTRFLELKADREAREAASEQTRQNILRQELAWIRRGAKARTTKQKARIERYESLVADEPLAKDSSMEMSAASTRLGRKIMEINGLKGEVDGRTLFSDFEYIAVPGDRIGIIGPNGSGKSTLLQIIADKRSPEGGEVILGPTVKLGYFTQEHEEMDESMRVIEYIREAAETVTTAEGQRITAAQMLERFLFQPSMQWTLIGKLSGGEKRRLQLLRMLMTAPNVLLLDEPTNDLDVETLAILEQYLDDFPGIVIAVSHDRYFLDRVAERIWSFEQGQIQVHVGNYSEYMDWLEKNPSDRAGLNASEQQKGGTASAASQETRQERKPKLKMSYKDEREYEQIEGKIAEAESRLERITADMEAAFSDSARLQELMKEQSAAEEQLNALMERWAELAELAEQIEAQKRS
ncbi:ABC-F family ATP-binding cassette domain-containing protein [Paenibacillus aquistagni]|uniref:ABC-F family ATP-binding cassette domain-containing protein n=1 Tax=Paenibacillus aquistagni TaxID=1852522 RepID=UPI00145AAED6|nr:ABC-F family ATP-binding cassette domain-containing protein [Paenibacillus aquistagni]NMM55332.1 ABC-F family ATP-binding cassette domain-containing protein [Paenibacillus aquistagni]